jgi:hypothetical protein
MSRPTRASERVRRLGSSRRVRLAAVVAWLATATPAVAQDPLAPARDLYVSARYEEALTVLDGVKKREATQAVVLGAVEQYRALCLMALGRPRDAEAAIEALVRYDPLRSLPDDTPPRLRTLFVDVRGKLLPDLVMQEYVAAKRAFDTKDYETASRKFRDVLAMLGEPELRNRGADLETLAGGFLTLSTAALETSAPAPPAAPEAAAEVPAPGPAPAPEPRLYTIRDGDVVPPLTIRQSLPPFPAQLNLRVRASGIVEVVVDERGRVEQVSIVEPVHPVYDPIVIKAAASWLYRPAMRGDQPVKFRKMVQVTLNTP